MTPDKVSYVCDDDRRPSWDYLPDGFAWRTASWGDRARVALVLVAVIAIALVGSVR